MANCQSPLATRFFPSMPKITYGFYLSYNTLIVNDFLLFIPLYPFHQAGDFEVAVGGKKFSLLRIIIRVNAS
jgi:hypothetical protein